MQQVRGLVSGLVRGLIQSAGSGGAAYVGPLDSLTTDLWAAYSAQRALVSSYTGALIRVRRSSDNAEQDIAQTGGALDSAALLTFCGAGSGFIAKLYDQAGSARDITISTTTKQPRIVSSGVLDVIATGRAGMLFDGSNDCLSLATKPAPMSLYMTVSIDATKSSGLIAYGGASNYIGYYQAGAGVGTNSGAGSPSTQVNGSAISPDTADRLSVLARTGVPKVITVENVTTTGWSGIGLFDFFPPASSISSKLYLCDLVMYQSSGLAGVEAALNDSGWIY